MCGGPSTGIPTKSEKGDLNIALDGLHGDVPHLVLAPLDIADCVFTTGWSVNLAQHLQTTAIVLSDQFIGQSTAVVCAPRRCENILTTATRATDYLTYKLTSSGLSYVASPSDISRRFTADDLEHNEKGTPSATHSEHLHQLDKRAYTLTGFDFGLDWAEVAGTGAVALICFGSASAAALANEHAAERYYRAVANNSACDKTAKIAGQFADDEYSHAPELLRMLVKLPENITNSRVEDNDRHMPE
jgi:2-oxoglutarate ferredoxin oxidoreductase subunit alpha